MRLSEHAPGSGSLVSDTAVLMQEAESPQIKCFEVLEWATRKPSLQTGIQNTNVQFSLFSISFFSQGTAKFCSAAQQLACCHQPAFGQEVLFTDQSFLCLNIPLSEDSIGNLWKSRSMRYVRFLSHNTLTLNEMSTGVLAQDAVRGTSSADEKGHAPGENTTWDVDGRSANKWELSKEMQKPTSVEFSELVPIDDKTWNEQLSPVSSFPVSSASYSCRLEVCDSLRQRDAKLHFLIPLSKEDAEWLKTNLTRYVYTLKVTPCCHKMTEIFTKLYQVRKDLT